jgi:hypothetical protein
MKRRIAAALTILLWAFFTYIGYDGINGVIRQHTSGYPNAGQWHYYIHFPLAMLFLSVVLLLFARKMHAGLFIALWVLQLVLFFPFFLGTRAVFSRTLSILGRNINNVVSVVSHGLPQSRRSPPTAMGRTRSYGQACV